VLYAEHFEILLLHIKLVIIFYFLNVIDFSQGLLSVLKVCNVKILSFWNWLAFALAYRRI